jgi:RNA polymerase sigma-70 factor (ECF subfamily)
MPEAVGLSLVAPGEIVDNGVDNRTDGILEATELMSQAKPDRPVWGTPDKALLADLIERGRAGDLRAMESLYEMFKRPVFSLQYRHTMSREAAEDLLQDVFVKVFTHLHEVRDAETFPAWVYRIALNTCYSHLRQKKAQAGRDIPLDEVESRVFDSNTERAESDLKTPLETAIRSLPARLQNVFVLHDVQGFKHEEIARLMKCSVGTSKSQLFKARMRLRAVLKARQVV